LTGFELATELKSLNHHRNEGEVLAFVPEVIDGQKYGRKVDVWSFGLFVLELILGRHPYKDKDGNDISSIFIDQNPLDFYKDQIIGKYSPQLIKLMRRCLTKDPTKRAKVSDLAYENYIR
jgi:serine/threonine protein kinase